MFVFIRGVSHSRWVCAQSSRLVAVVIDRGDPLPLYEQLHNELRDSITRGDLAAGERLPSESELARRFAVNRLTARQALAELARAGLIVARQGVGTFVARRSEPFVVELSPTDWAVEHERAAHAAEAAGHGVSETLLDVRRLEAPPQVVRHLGEGSMIWMESVYHVDGEPTIRSEYWTRSSLSPHDVQRRALSGFGTRAIRDVAGADMYYAWRSFDAVAASRRDAGVLGVPLGAPLLLRTGLNSDAAGRPLLYLERSAPAGRMRMVMRNRPPSPAELQTSPAPEDPAEGGR